MVAQRENTTIFYEKRQQRDSIAQWPIIFVSLPMSIEARGKIWCDATRERVLALLHRSSNESQNRFFCYIFHWPVFYSFVFFYFFFTTIVFSSTDEANVHMKRMALQFCIGPLFWGWGLKFQTVQFYNCWRFELKINKGSKVERRTYESLKYEIEIERLICKKRQIWILSKLRELQNLLFFKTNFRFPNRKNSGIFFFSTLEDSENF